MADTRSIVELILALPGRHAARVRRQAAKLLVRYLGGDLSLVDEVCALRGLQEELAVRAPEDPARAFGEAVEAAPPAEYLSRVCTDIVGRTVPLMLTALVRRLLPQRTSILAKHHTAGADASMVLEVVFALHDLASK